MVKRKGNLISSLCNISNILLADSNARKAKKRSKRFIEKHDQNIIDEDMAIAASFYNLSYKTSPYVTYVFRFCGYHRMFLHYIFRDFQGNGNH